MMLAVLAQSRVVIGCNGIYHIDVHVEIFSQFHALTDDRAHVILLVRFVEIVVAWQDILLDILPKV